MKKFTYSLQKVLNLREFEESQAEIELGKAVSYAESLRRELKILAEKRLENSRKQFAVMDITLMQQAEYYGSYLDLKKEELLTELTQAELAVEEKRKDFLVALQNRKTLDSLKDKQFALYKKEIQRQEDVILDDIANSRH
ncbi:MAG: flagellar export protein FliJ [Spirochaetaceae bacterium]|nr:flagellar export protein FliJ [Spirochaetaceae bacterium]